MRENELLKSRNAELLAHVEGLKDQQRAATEQLSAIQVRGWGGGRKGGGRRRAWLRGEGGRLQYKEEVAHDSSACGDCCESDT